MKGWDGWRVSERKRRDARLPHLKQPFLETLYAIRYLYKRKKEKRREKKTIYSELLLRLLRISRLVRVKNLSKMVN